MNGRVVSLAFAFCLLFGLTATAQVDIWHGVEGKPRVELTPYVAQAGDGMAVIVCPGGSIREFYQKSRHLSDYIRHAITEKHQSVWIAQRNGRTKDGCDRTDQGIIKMFCMSRSEDKLAAFTELHIVPVSISYEWEPCDVLKTLELYESQFARYTKKPGEDLNSILTGIVQLKDIFLGIYAHPVDG